MRLDIALMHRARREGALDDDFSLLETFGDVALLDLEPAADVGRFSLELHEVVQDRSVGFQRIVDLDRPWQHLVVDLDQRAGLRRDRLGGRSHRRDRVAGKQRLLARHHVAAHPAHVLDAEHDRLVDREIDDVARRHHRFYARQRLGPGGVDRPDAGVRMRTTQNLAPDHAGHVGVGGKGRAPRHFVGAVRANGTLADPLVVGDDVHCAASRISAAVSRTARTILS
jgi:hypothetical protein